MQAGKGNERRRSDIRYLANEATPRGLRDDRQIQAPVEISARFRPGCFLSPSSERPSTVGSHLPKRQRNSDQHGIYTESSSSYFPHIHEGYMARELREQKARIASTRKAVSRDSLATSRRPFPTARGRLESDLGKKAAASSTHSEDIDRDSLLSRLDRRGMEVIYDAFQQMGEMDEEEFVAEMLRSLHAGEQANDRRVELAGQLSEMFRRADLHSKGILSWGDFSAFISQSSVITSALEDTVINKYQADSVPSSLNFVAEIDGLIYLPSANTVLIHNIRDKGFQVYDPTNHRTRSPRVERFTRGSVIDAVYTSHGRYIITASTSPVLTFYDQDSLEIRQQVPTKSFQTALALHSPSITTNLLYSAGADGQVHAWDLSSLTPRHSFFDAHKNNPMAGIADLEVLPATSHLACGSMDGKILMLDLTSGRLVQTMDGHTKSVSMLRYCAENKYLVSSGIDHKLQVWNPHLEQKVGSLPGHRHQLIGLHVRSNSPEVITADSSGVMKIWDLRKFTAIQTIVKELYVKDHRSTANRPMTAMCYLDNIHRIAIAHSTVFFLDPLKPMGNKTQDELTSTLKSDWCGDSDRNFEQAELEEDFKPLYVGFNTPSRLLIAILPRQIVCWDASTGLQMLSTPLQLNSEVFCVVVMEGHYSCYVGCEDGSLARLLLPNGVVVACKRIHRSPVNLIRLYSPTRTLLSTSNDGNVVFSDWETLEPQRTVNHWRGIQSIRNFRIPPIADLGDTYSVPLILRPHFIGNEIERLTHAFANADDDRDGKISMNALPEVLGVAFPSSEHDRKIDIMHTGQWNKANNADSTLTFSMFMQVVKDALTCHTASCNSIATSTISCFDVSPQLQTLLTASASDMSFCLWNLKNCTVLGEGAPHFVELIAPPARSICTSQCISFLKYLHPLPYFVCVVENSACLSVWSSQIITPITSQPNQCILKYVHSHSTGAEFRTRASTTFLTDPRFVNQDVKSIEIRTIDWFYDERDDKKILCIGDATGNIQLLDLKPLLRRIEDFRKHRGSVTMTSQQQELLPSMLLQKIHRWPTTRVHGVGVRYINIQNVDNLIQPNANKRVILVSVNDYGRIQIWSLDGVQLGDLCCGDASGVSKSHWKLRLDVDELKQKSRDNAETILRQVDQRNSVVIRQVDVVERQSASIAGDQSSCMQWRRPTRILHAFRDTVDPCPALPKPVCPSRQSNMSAEEALVAWRRRVHKNSHETLGKS